MSHILSIGTATPGYRISQKHVSDFIISNLTLSHTDQRKLQLLFENSGIEQRYTCVPDYTGSMSGEGFFPAEKSGTFPGIGERVKYYFNVAPQLCVDAVQQCEHADVLLNKVTHLITVSCTGMAAPGLDLMLMRALNLPLHTQRSSVNFMGCYASMHALKTASYICRADPSALVLIVSAELCSLYFRNSPDWNNLSSSVLFSDGAAACFVGNPSAIESPNSPRLELASFYSEIIPAKDDDMAWEISSDSFLMRLSSYVPQLIKEGIKPVINRALHAAKTDQHNIAHWALHPGGKKILDFIAMEMNLAASQIEHSYASLRNFGNMSSASILFILGDVLRVAERDQTIFAAAFGPGLTVETA